MNKTSSKNTVSEITKNDHEIIIRWSTLVAQVEVFVLLLPLILVIVLLPFMGKNSLLMIYYYRYFLVPQLFVLPFLTFINLVITLMAKPTSNYSGQKKLLRYLSFDIITICVFAVALVLKHIDSIESNHLTSIMCPTALICGFMAMLISNFVKPHHQKVQLKLLLLLSVVSFGAVLISFLAPLT